MGRSRGKNNATILVGFELGKGAKEVKQALKGMSGDISAFESRLQGVSANASTASAGLQRFTDASRGINRELKQASRYTESFAKSQDELRDSLRTNAERIRDQVSNLDKAERSYRDASDAAAGFGDTASNLNAIRGLGEGAGLDLGGAQIAADVFDAAEGFKRLGPALNAAVAGSNFLSGAAGTISTVAEAAGLGLSGTALSLTTVAAVAAPFVVAFAALSAVFQTNQEQLDALRAAAEARNQVAQDSLTLTAQEAEARRTALIAERDALQESSAVFRQTQENLDAMNLGVFTGAAAGLFGLGEEATVTAEQAGQAEKRIAEINEQLRQLDGVGAQANIAINDTIAAIVAEGEARQTTAQDIQRLTAQQAADELEANRLQQENIQQTLGRLRELGDTQADEEIAALSQQLSELQTREAALTAEILPAIDAREQETAAIAANRDALLTNAAAEQDAVRERARLAGLSAEQIRDEVAAREQDAEAIQAELDVLRSSGDTSQEVTDRIAALETELSNAQASANDLRAAEPAAIFRETANAVRDADAAIAEVRKGLADAQAQADSQRDLQDSRAAQALARQQSRQLQDYARDTAKRQKDLLKKEADELASLQEDLAGGTTEGEKQRLEILNRAQQDDQKALTTHLKRLRQIEKDSRREIEDAAANLDAVRLFDALNRGKEQVDQENDQFNEAKDERRAAAQEQLADLTTNLAQERAERIADYQQKIADLRQNFAEDEAERKAERTLRQQREAEDRALAAQQQAQDRAREDAARQAQADQRIAAIESGLQQELNTVAGGEQRKVDLIQQGTQAAIGAAQNFASAIQGVAARIQAAAASAQAAGSRSSLTTNRLNSIQSSANRQNYTVTGSRSTATPTQQAISTRQRLLDEATTGKRLGGYQSFGGGGVVQGSGRDHIPVLARPGEGVFTPEQMRAMGSKTYNITVGDIHAPQGMSGEAFVDMAVDRIISELEAIA